MKEWKVGDEVIVKAGHSAGHEGTVLEVGSEFLRLDIGVPGNKVIVALSHCARLIKKPAAKPKRREWVLCGDGLGYSDYGIHSGPLLKKGETVNAVELRPGEFVTNGSAVRQAWVIPYPTFDAFLEALKEQS